MEEASEAVKQYSQTTCATLSVIDDIVNGVADGEVIEKIIEQGRRSCTGTKSSLVEYNIAGCNFQLPCIYKPMVNESHDKLVAEVNKLHSEVHALVAEHKKLRSEALENKIILD
eukprot:15339831-Ditylum_brightwellii.AAC.1